MPRGSKVLSFDTISSPDRLGTLIADMYTKWDNGRIITKERWRELYKYLYATDTKTTSNASNPWKNTTTTPKLTQIRDNLYANYMASMFPKRRWLLWEGANRSDDTKKKKEAIRAYMGHVIDYPGFKETIARLVLDYLDNGNCFVTIDWLDETVLRDGKVQTGYVGPVLQRISPYDIVMNPTSPDFTRSPKIVRSLVTLGDVKDILERETTNDNERKIAEKLYDYLRDIRARVSGFEGELQTQDEFYRVDGFLSFRHYLESGYAEILTFYGDIYDNDSGDFYKNHVIQVVDRHKVIHNEPNPSDFGHAPIYHSGWRTRQDNLWAMGPFDNLVGLQYRLDHIENLKADFFDIVYAPPLKVKGYVEDFVWGPFEKIYVGDDGDVNLMTPTINPLEANFELQRLEASMEELAGAPKEAMGFRTPGEKTAYEVQRLENASARIFMNKIAQFEEEVLEPALNGALELARRKMTTTSIRFLDDEYNIAAFKTLSAQDITGAGRIRPVAARHFAEVSERVQNVTNFFSSAIGQDPEVKLHMSSLEIARLFEELLDLKDYRLVEENIRLTERAEAQQLANQLEEDTAIGLETPSGMTPEDSDQPFV